MTDFGRRDRWKKLLSKSRLFDSREASPQEDRSEFERDHDRVIFASAFRRLKDKTQVFPLSPSDYTRTRLTHSLEASCVGRSLGGAAAQILKQEGLIDENSDIPTLVAAACLAHDIGNPPFGHSGEAAIQRWAEKKAKADGLKLSVEEWRDIKEFEGNAQGFRILTRLQNRLRKGGIQPTLAFLGAMTKYPRSSSPERVPDLSKASEKKFGYFQDDAEAAKEVFQGLGMVRRGEGMCARHPLAFLTEAADDICYVVMDLEDAFKLKIVSYQKTREILSSLTKSAGDAWEPYQESSEISRLRAHAVNELTKTCAQVFKDNLRQIECGSFDQALIKKTEFDQACEALRRFAKEHIYTDERVLEIEYAGFQTIGGLLDMFCSAAVHDEPSGADAKLLKLLPGDSFDRPNAKGDRRALSPYQRVLAVTDYVSGMTDSFAVELYQKLSGIRLPV